MPQGESLSIQNGAGIGYTVPQRVHPGTEDFEISFRVTAPMENKQIALRDRKGRNHGVMSLADFKAKLLMEVAEKSREV